MQNSVQFIERTMGVVIDSESLMVSFDVKALYTSLPVDRTIEIVKRKLADKRPWQERTTLSAEDVIELLKTCLKATYFTFRGNFFSFNRQCGNAVTCFLNCGELVYGEVWRMH